MARRGLPPIMMSISMTLIWYGVAVTFWPFTAVASVVLTVAWFFVKNGTLLAIAATAIIGSLGAYLIHYAG